MKTRSITLFDYLFIGSLIVNLFIVIAGWDYMVLEIHNEVHAAGGGPDAQLFTSTMAPVFVGTSFAISLGLWALVSFGRLGFVRFIMVALTLLEVVSLALDAMAVGTNFYFLLGGVIAAGMRVMAMVFVFQPDAGMWLRREI